eukprot:scaffold5891_cov121-Isochrysis_galbana.AAC.11
MNSIGISEKVRTMFSPYLALNCAPRNRRSQKWSKDLFLAVVEDVGLRVHPLEVEEEIGDCGAHVRVADLAERWPLLLDGDEVVVSVSVS